MSAIKLPLESKWVNVANFIIFDITLISLVYFLTTDVMGRFNAADLDSGERRRLFLTNYPLIGGGLCSTRKFRAALLLFARVVGLSLILATNLTIDGETARKEVTNTATLVTYGKADNLTLDEYRRAAFLRSGCQSTRPYKFLPDDPDNHTVMYYGEIRNDSCEIDQPGLFERAIKYSTDLINESLTVGDCPTYDRRTYFGIESAIFWCKNGAVQCGFDYNIPGRIKLRSCRAWYKYKNFTYISGTTQSSECFSFLILTHHESDSSCLSIESISTITIEFILCDYRSDRGAVWPLMPEEPTQGRKFQGLNVSSREWFPLIGLDPSATLIDSVHMVYGSGRAPNQTVKEYKDVNITVIKPFWFAALGLKLMLIVILAITSLILWNMGYAPVAHDEMRLAELLRRRIEENDPRLTVLTRDDTPSIYLNADPQSVGANGTSGRVKVYAAGRPGASPSQPGISGTIDQSDPNYQAHLDEASFY